MKPIQGSIEGDDEEAELMYYGQLQVRRQLSEIDVRALDVHNETVYQKAFAGRI